MRESRPIEIVHEDGHLIVVNKPAGLLVVPTPKQESHTLTSILNRQCASRLNDIRLFPCHRLDRDTSGLIIYAKGSRVQQLMAEQFKNHRVHKKYVALVHGRLERVEGTIKSAVEDVAIGQQKHRHQPKMAITTYKVAREGSGYSVVNVWPLTGRTNQIRIHFAQLKHPLLGERKYCFARDFTLKFRRVALHAAQLDFTHPVTGHKLNLSLPLPEDMLKFIGDQKCGKSLA
jgi:23S rRNA pseudouridine1911/1915/1917 synthase